MRLLMIILTNNEGKKINGQMNILSTTVLKNDYGRKT